MTGWPWMLVLDGLDEVTEPAIRKRLIARVTEFVNDAEANHCDMLVVLTTRPIGYTENIAPNHFERIELDDLELTEAVRYGDLATRVRLGNDLDRIERVRKRLRAAARGRSPAAPVADSPAGSDPHHHHRRSRPTRPGTATACSVPTTTPFSRLNATSQRDCTRFSKSTVIRSSSCTRLSALSCRYAANQGIAPTPPSPVRNFASSLGRFCTRLGSSPPAKTRRCWIRSSMPPPKARPDCAPRRRGYGFDVRSLQELMAGMYLSSGPFDDVLVRLRVAAASPFWRNTWPFAAGRLFSTPQRHQHEGVTGLVEKVDDHTPHRLGGMVPVGPRLALDVIDDGMAGSQPRFRDRLLHHGMRVLWEPGPPVVPAITRLLVRFANTGDDQRTVVADRLRDALGATPTS